MFKLHLLFVCLGNICRSPTAEAVFSHQLKQRDLQNKFVLDSAGMTNAHAGRAPDQRSQAAAAVRQYDLSSIKSRPVTEQDFVVFDYIIAMDRSNLRALQKKQPSGTKAKLRLLMSFSDTAVSEVPDPYYGNQDGFEQVLDYCEAATDGLINYLLQHHSWL